VSFEGGFRFTFTMVFAAAPSGILDEADLLSPPGRFANMRFFAPGRIEWERTSEPLFTRLRINPLEPDRMGFTTYVGFRPPEPEGRVCILGIENHRVEISCIGGDPAPDASRTYPVVLAGTALSARFRKSAPVARFTGHGGSRSLRARRR
jgi:hypothetical protein